MHDVSVSKEELKKLIDTIHDQDAVEVYDFIEFLKMKREQQVLQELENISVTSMDFWDNPVDNEIWNDV